MNARSILGMLLLLLASGSALAVGIAPLPEPGVLELLAISAIAGVAVAIRKRRK